MGASPSKRFEEQQQSDTRSQSLPQKQTNRLSSSYEKNQTDRSQRSQTVGIRQLISEPNSSQHQANLNNFKASAINLNLQNQLKNVNPASKVYYSTGPSQNFKDRNEELARKRCYNNKENTNFQLIKDVNNESVNNSNSNNKQQYIKQVNTLGWKQTSNSLLNQQQTQQNLSSQNVPKINSNTNKNQQSKNSTTNVSAAGITGNGSTAASSKPCIPSSQQAITALNPPITYLQNITLMAQNTISKDSFSKTHCISEINPPQKIQQLIYPKQQYAYQSTDSSIREDPEKLTQEQQVPQPPSVLVSSQKHNPIIRDQYSSLNSSCNPKIIQGNTTNTIQMGSNLTSHEKQSQRVDLMSLQSSIAINDSQQQPPYFYRTLPTVSTFTSNNPFPQPSTNHNYINQTQLYALISTKQDAFPQTNQLKPIQNMIVLPGQYPNKPIQIQQCIQNNIEAQTRPLSKDLLVASLQTTQQQNIQNISSTTNNTNPRIINSLRSNRGTYLTQPSIPVHGDIGANYSCCQAITEEKTASVGSSSRCLYENHSKEHIKTNNSSHKNSCIVVEGQEPNPSSESSGKKQKEKQENDEQQPIDEDNIDLVNLQNSSNFDLKEGAASMAPDSPQQHVNQTTVEFQLTKTEEEDDDYQDHGQKEFKKVDIPLDMIHVQLHFPEQISSATSCETENTIVNQTSIKSFSKPNCEQQQQLDNLQVSQIKVEQTQSQIASIDHRQMTNQIRFASPQNTNEPANIAEKIQQFKEQYVNNKYPINYGIFNKSQEEETKMNSRIHRKIHRLPKNSDQKGVHELSLLEDFDYDIEGNTQTLDSREELTELADSPREFARDHISFGPEKRFLTENCEQDDNEGTFIPTGGHNKTKNKNDQIHSYSSMLLSSTTNPNGMFSKTKKPINSKELINKKKILQQQKQLFTSVNSYQLGNSPLLHQIDGQYQPISQQLTSDDILFKYDKTNGTLTPLTQIAINQFQLDNEAIPVYSKQRQSPIPSRSMTLPKHIGNQNINSFLKDSMLSSSFNSTFQLSKNDKRKNSKQLNQLQSGQQSFQQLSRHSSQHQPSEAPGSTAATSKRHSFQQLQQYSSNQSTQQQGYVQQISFTQKIDRNLTVGAHKKYINSDKFSRTPSSSNDKVAKGSVSNINIKDKYQFNQPRCHLYTEVLNHYSQLLGRKTKEQELKQQQQQQGGFARGRKALR